MKGLFRAWDERGFVAKASEAARRAYRELVRRRSRARVVVASEADLTCRPVFIVGTFRSGTTLLRFILDSHSRICIPAETEFIGHLQPLIDNPRCATGFESLGFDDTAVVTELRRFSAFFFENYARSWDKPRWGDKSPSYVDHLDLIHRLFPEAQYVVITRHGLDQAHSFSRGGAFMREQLETFCEEGQDTRPGAVRFWKDHTDKMLAFADAHPDSCHIIRYEDLCQQPEETLRGVFEFLDEAWEPKVLDYHEFRHDVGFEDGRTMAVQGFKFSGHHYRNWPRQLALDCAQLAEPTLSRLGYTVSDLPADADSKEG